jgi:hypothetical protein
MRRLQDLPTTASEDFSKVGLNAVYAYLRERGIGTKQLIDAYGIRILRAIDVGKLGDDRAAVVFPHYDMTGSTIDWWSARLVDVGPPPTGFGAMVGRGKMYCPPREPVAAYLPPTLDWGAIPEGATIFIHESCMKAIAGSQCMRYSVGLNGVWGWSSKKHDIALVPQIRDLPWTAKRLKCVVVFDSNAATSDGVALAIRRFAEKMLEICKVRVQHRLLPMRADGAHWGFDDFFATNGVDASTQWLDGEAVDVDISELEAFRLQLNEEVCVVRSLKRVVSHDGSVVMGRGEFCDINYAHMNVFIEDRPINVPKLWLQWERRRVVNSMDYMPGKAMVHDEKLNLWQGMGIEPAMGQDVSRWQKILLAAVPDPVLRQWLIQWMAYPLQNIGAKLSSFVHFYGPPGTGKQAVLHPLVKIYGRNAVTIGREQLAGDFNSSYSNKQFINADELHGGHGHEATKINNKMKRLITQETLMVNTKGVPEYQVSNCANIVTTSNYVDAIKLDEDDRRACVIRFDTRLGAEFWKDYFKWVDEDGGAEAIYGHLLSVDLTGFEPKGWAPMTEDKELVISAGRAPMESWIRDLKEDPDAVLLPVLKGLRYATAEQLAASYLAGDDQARLTPGIKNSLGKALSNAGLKRIELFVDGMKERLWVLRHGTCHAGDTWDTAKVRDHLLKFKPKFS